MNSNQLIEIVKKGEDKALIAKVEELITKTNPRLWGIFEERFVNKKTLQEIGDKYEISRERIRQLLERITKIILPRIGEILAKRNETKTSLQLRKNT